MLMHGTITYIVSDPENSHIIETYHCSKKRKSCGEQLSTQMAKHMMRTHLTTTASKLIAKSIANTS